MRKAWDTIRVSSKRNVITVLQGLSMWKVVFVQQNKLLSPHRINDKQQNNTEDFPANRQFEVGEPVTYGPSYSRLVFELKKSSVCCPCAYRFTIGGKTVLAGTEHFIVCTMCKP